MMLKMLCAVLSLELNVLRFVIIYDMICVNLKTERLV